MRKGILLLLILLFLFRLPVESKNRDLKFIIVYDSKEENKIETKNEIVDLINKTLKNVDEENYLAFFKATSKELENENRKVDVYFNTIYFYLGDHKGEEIKGNILYNSFCMVEVKPKSLIRKWFNF